MEEKEKCHSIKLRLIYDHEYHGNDWQRQNMKDREALYCTQKQMRFEQKIKWKNKRKKAIQREDEELWSCYLSHIGGPFGYYSLNNCF